MTTPIKGRFFLVFFLFIFSSPPLAIAFVDSSSVSIQNEHGHDQIPLHETEPKSPRDFILNSCSVKTNVEEAEVRDGERGRAVSVTKYSPFWSERFQFMSAVKLDSDATCINVLPFRDYEGLSKYVAVGDEKGRVFVFLRNGDVAAEFHTKSESSIMAMVSYMSVFKNESVVVTGHHNGLILVHKIYEGLNGEELGSPRMGTVSKFVAAEGGDEGLPITMLEVHHVGRMRYILSTDLSGKIRVFREDGTLHGSAMSTSRPLVFLKQRLLFLTETGAGSLDLRSMKIKESDCEGLNHSLVRNYVFDAAERSKAYGFTSDGDLIHVLLLGDSMNFKCRVRSKKKLEMNEPLAFLAIKGYLLIVDVEKVFVYNVSTPHYVRAGAPRFLFSAGLDEIRSLFLTHQAMDTNKERRNTMSLIASDHEKLIVLGLGGDYVGMYRSNLPVTKAESNTMLWTNPVLFFILFLFGAWQFFAKKKEALTLWGPDNHFSSTSATDGASLGSNTGDRSFTDSSSGGSDMGNLRSSGLRSRRYASPSRYQGGAAGSFRPSSADPGARPASIEPNYRADPSSRPASIEPNYRADPTSRPASIEPNYRADPSSRTASIEPNYRADPSSRPASIEPNYRVDPSSRPASIKPNYRAAPELKYRGSILEPTGFRKRRESLFMNSQVVDDNN
ncbi:leucine-rich repeat transmembrane protein kinase [Hibiscus syriacus]|uniref:Leucine-rich repeat transmembrane protein kinase n=1 Tax=Hibiscus syriacus TaxID=106335 RepID=A0A6A2YHE6_HIBSY|nr:leucine-rich repeat transmembrane protein kinase [Hibiscus syriacus]